MKKLKLKPHSYPGKLIVFEGVDGSGKTTLLEKATSFLTEHKIPFITLKMPSDRVRNLDIFHNYDNSPDDTTRNMIDLTNLTIFVSGDRLLTLDSQIIPALKKGIYVLCDRYCFTGYVRCTSPIIRKISNRFLAPDIAFLTSASPATLKNRVKSRKNESNYFYDELDVRSQIKKFEFLAKKHHFTIINTEEPLEKSIHLMHQELLKLNKKISQ